MNNEHERSVGGQEAENTLELVMNSLLQRIQSKPTEKMKFNHQELFFICSYLSDPQKRQLLKDFLDAVDLESSMKEDGWACGNISSLINRRNNEEVWLILKAIRTLPDNLKKTVAESPSHHSWILDTIVDSLLEKINTNEHPDVLNCKTNNNPTLSDYLTKKLKKPFVWDNIQLSLNILVAIENGSSQDLEKALSFNDSYWFSLFTVSRLERYKDAVNQLKNIGEQEIKNAPNSANP